MSNESMPTGQGLRTGDASPLHMRLSALANLLGGVRYRYGSEVQLHDVMARLLTEAGHSFEHEYRLDQHNRADFWLDGLVVEVKIDGSMGDALRQVGRYIGLPQVQGVLLAGTPQWAGAPLLKRPAWQGKPFQMTRLLRQAL